MGQHKLKKEGNTGTSQWETDGDCKKCRKQAYCSKICNQARMKHIYDIKQAAIQMTNKVLARLYQ